MGKSIAFDVFGVSASCGECAFETFDVMVSCGECAFGALGEWEAAESDLDKFNAMKAEKVCDLAAALERETHRQDYLTECRAMFKRARGRAKVTKQARARAEYVDWLRGW